MSKYIFTNDFLFHAQRESPEVFHEELFSLLQIPFKLGTGLNLENIADFTNCHGERFSRCEFFKRSGILSPANNHYAYDITKISSSSWDYFKSLFEKGTIFIGCEIGVDLREWLTDNGYVYINFWYHPYKLLDDIFFLVGTNSEPLYDKLSKHRVAYTTLQMTSRYYATYLKFNNLSSAINLAENSCLFIGQTYRDKSVQNGDKFLSILDFKNKIELLLQSYSMIYYVPHPYAGKNKQIDKFIASNSRIKKIENVPTYYLLASDAIKKVVSLSSSVIYEAKTFGKDAEYLYKPLFDIDSNFSLNSFVGIYSDYFTGDFWNELFGWHSKTIYDHKSCSENVFTNGQGKLRYLMNAYWGFKYIGRQERTEEKARIAYEFVYAIKNNFAFRIIASVKSLLSFALSHLIHH